MVTMTKGRWKRVPLRAVATAALAGTVAFGVAACGDSGGGGSSTAASSAGTTTTASAPKGDPGLGTPVAFDSAPADLHLTDPGPAACPAGGKKLTIGYDRYSDSDENVLAMSHPIEDSFKKMGCVTLLELTDNLDPATVQRNMQTFIQRKVDGVILQSALAAVQPAAVKLLDNAKIPVLTLSITAPGTTFIGPDDYANGVIGGKSVAEAFKTHFPGQKPYVLLLALPKSGDTPKHRHDGFKDGIKQVLPDLKDSDFTDVSADATPTSSHDRTLETLGRVPSGRKLIVAGVNDATAQGMVRAIAQRGLSKNAVVVGMGGVPPTSTTYICKEPEWAGTVANFPENSGVAATGAIVALASGKEIPKWISIPGKWMARDKIGDFYPQAACK
ncbi:MAG: regulatory protein IclR [Conexibacter sp.]|nr:regulatory protein IclR [Conexibacter sp.]